MSLNEFRAYFTETKSTLQDIIPRGEGEIVIEYLGDSERQVTVNVIFKCPEISTLNDKDVFSASRDNRRFKKKFIAPRQFEPIDIDVTIEEKAGMFQTRKAGSKRLTLSLRMVQTKTFNLEESNEMQNLVIQMVALEEPLTIVPEVEDPIELQPIVGDVTTTPKISMQIKTTSGLPLVLIVSDKELRTVAAKTQEAITVLEDVTTVQINLQHFVAALKKELSQMISGGKKVEVESSAGDVHIKVKSKPNWFYYATQVTPSEDPIITEKIKNVVAQAQRENGFVTILVTQIDDELISLYENDQINIIDIFHGIELRGVMMGDVAVREFIEDKLGLELVEYADNPEGNYTPSQFTERLGKVKI